MQPVRLVPQEIPVLRVLQALQALQAQYLVQLDLPETQALQGLQEPLERQVIPAQPEQLEQRVLLEPQVLKVLPDLLVPLVLQDQPVLQDQLLQASIHRQVLLTLW